MPWELNGNSIGPNAWLGSTSAQPLRIRTNNVQKMLITTAGEVGIGTTGPQAKLHISSDEPQLRLDSATNRAAVRVAKGGALQWDFGVGTALPPATPNNDFWFGDFTEYRLVLQKGTGNVGIGTTAPGAKLDISGSGGANQCCAPVRPTLSLAEASSTQNRQAWLQFHNAGEAEAYIRLAGAGPAGSGREGQRRLEIGDSQGVNTSLTVQGNVGIGTTNPQTATGGRVLHIDNPNGASVLRLGNGTPTGGQWEWQSAAGPRFPELRLVPPQGAGPANVNLITVLADGRVSIGSITDWEVTAKLEVGGRIGCSSLRAGRRAGGGGVVTAAADDGTNGILGTTAIPGVSAVIGQTDVNDAYAVFGRDNGNGWAGYFEGFVQVSRGAAPAFANL